MIGTCEYCGQAVMASYPSGIETQEEYNEYASKVCDCDRARYMRNVVEQIGRAQLRVTELFETGLSVFEPIADKRLIALMHEAVELVGYGKAKYVKIELGDGTKANIVRSSGYITVERSETQKYKFAE